MKKVSFATILLILIIFTLTGCDNAPKMPLPSTYLRLEVEKTKPLSFNEKEYPFTFQYPNNITIEKLDSKSKRIRWFNLNYKKYNFVVNVSYIPLNNVSSLRASIEDCYTFLKRHEKLSGGIIEQDYKNEEKHIYGTVFEIKGSDVVSPMQFYLTDSNKYFVRFALNCNFKPNNDSCQVIIHQIKKDMTGIINTFNWK